MALTVLLAGHDVSARASGLTFSNVDPGGYEACAFTLPSTVEQPKPGDPIRIMDGLSVAWEGLVEDPGPTQNHATAQGQVQGVGYGARLKDDPYQCIYVDRDLSHWQNPSTSRQFALLGANLRPGSMSVAPDAGSGLPALIETISDAWESPYTPTVEAWYDAGPALLIAAVYYNLHTSGADDGGVSWAHLVTLSPDETAPLGSIEATANLNAGSGSGAITGYLTPATALRFVILTSAYSATPAGAQGAQAVAAWRTPAVYGNHGLTRRGSDPGGLYAQDIAAHALAQATGIQAGIIDATAFVVAHSVYRDPTVPEQVIDDMAKLATVHWGVWESMSILDTTPRLDFRARPTAATCVVSRRDCDGLTITERRSQLYNRCTVTYTDAAGTIGQATVTAENPRMPPGTTRTLGPLAIGISSAAAAQDYAADALELAQASQRGGGSPTVPSSVVVPGGGRKPAHLLKAGLDRLKITDLPDSGSWTETDTRRFDTFRVKRVETTVDKGVPRTRVELDEGADLLEVLNARLAIDATITGGA